MTLRLLKAVSAALIAFLCPLPSLVAQAAQSPAPTALHINILEGEGALNNISTRTAREPIIQVEDQNHKPVAGAAVLFTIHSSAGEAGASFATPFSQTNALTMTTDAEGKAVAHGLTPNAVAGQLTVTVQATVGTVTTTAVIHMINSLISATTASASTSAAGASPGASSSSAPAGSTATSTGTVTSSTGTIATGGAATGASGGLLHVFHLIPKWAVVGGVTGVAATVAVVTVIVVTNSGGASISAGTGTVTGPH